MLKKMIFASCMLLLVNSCASKRHRVITQVPVETYDNAVYTDLSPTQGPEIIGDPILFGFNESSLPFAKTIHIQNLASSLKGKTLTVEGHCDERGTDEYNMALGMKRAETVKKALLSHVEDVTTISYGSRRPANPERTSEAYRQNRRAVILAQ